MADDQTEDGEPSLSGKQFLFPILSTNSEDKHDRKEVSPLLPSVSVPSLKEKESLEWLYNESYRSSVEEAGIESGKDIPKSDIVQETDGCSSDDSQFSGDARPRKKTKLKKKERQHDKKHYKKQKQKKHKKHKYKKKNHGQKVKEKEEEDKLMKLPSTIWIEESGLEFEKAFRIHKKPDHDNCSYGGLYRLDIALHKQDPKLKCMGLRPGQVVDLGQKPKKKEKKQESQQRYWQSGNLIVPGDSLLLFPSKSGKSSNGFSENFSYIPLELPLSAGEKEGISETLSFHEGTLISNKMISRTKDLNERVRGNPNDIEAWLALAELQGQYAQSGDLTSNSFDKVGLEKQKKIDKLSLEKKAAVLEQAVEKNPLSEDLIVAYMDVCVEFMDSDKIAEKWKNILFKQPQKTLLWKHYLMFCQTNFSAFSTSSTLAVYSKCFNTLSAIKDGIFKSHCPESDIEVGMVEIFIQFCQFLRQTGHSEKAVAAFQAFIEFNCFYPKSLEANHSTASAISFFETFWDSDVPRFGENDACGWDSWLRNVSENSDSNQVVLSEIFGNDAYEVNSRSIDQEKVISSGLERTASWIQLEAFRETDQLQPKRTGNDSDEQEELDAEDPDRVVLFQDINSVLFKISLETLKFQVICYFLAFLGVAVEFCSFDSCNIRLQTLMQSFLEDERQLVCFDSKDGWRLSCGWTKLQSGVSDILPNYQTPALRRFTRNIFNQALKVFSVELQAKLAAYWLRFEQDIFLSETNSKRRKQCYKAVRKLAKSLLKLEQHRNNLSLWMVFVEVEWAFGSTDEARRIVYSSLEQSPTLTSADPNSNPRYYSFVRSYCELEMGLRNLNDQAREKANFPQDERRNRILGIIALLVENGTFGLPESFATPSRILKTHRSLQEKSSQMLTDFQMWRFRESMGKNGQSLVDFMICYALFEYWSLGIDAAKSILDSLLTAVVQETSGEGQTFCGSKCHEEILVFYYRLLQFHSRHDICPVKPLRDLLLMALSNFKENPFFLHSFVNLELKSCVSAAARRFFDRVLSNSQTPVPWMYAILYERHRQKTVLSVKQNSPELFRRSNDAKDTQPTAVTVLPPSGMIHRLRSLYERAIVHPSARHCVALWRSYMNFEAENGNLRQAKAIFYQSLQCCAWAKVLYVDAVKIFPDSLQDVHDLMEEKELRIRAPLDELDLLLET